MAEVKKFRVFFEEKFIEFRVEKLEGDCFPQIEQRSPRGMENSFRETIVHFTRANYASHAHQIKRDDENVCGKTIISP